MPKPSILFLTHRVPYPPNRGDRIRTYHFLRHVAQHARVTLGCLADEPVSAESRQVLDQLCEEVSIVPVERFRRWMHAGFSFLKGRPISEGAFHSATLVQQVEKWARAKSFDAAICSSSALVDYLRIPELENSRRYVDLIDVDSQKWADYANESSFPKRWIFRQEARRLQQVESTLQTWVDGICVVSEPEAQLYRDTSGDTDVLQAITNGVDVDYFSPQPIAPEKQSGCVFVGALDYKPNVDGIKWFAEQVWPAIHQKNPGDSLMVVGREPVAEVRALAGIAGVEIVGTVPDIRPYLNQAKVVVVPLRIARGVQNKVLEALAMGKAVVSSRSPLVGLGTQDGTQVFAAEEKHDWINQVDRVMKDPAIRTEVGLAGQAYVSANHRWDQCLSGLMSFMGFKNEHLQNHRSNYESPMESGCSKSLEEIEEVSA